MLVSAIWVTLDQATGCAWRALLASTRIPRGVFAVPPVLQGRLLTATGQRASQCALPATAGRMTQSMGVLALVMVVRTRIRVRESIGVSCRRAGNEVVTRSKQLKYGVFVYLSDIIMRLRFSTHYLPCLLFFDLSCTRLREVQSAAKTHTKTSSVVLVAFHALREQRHMTLRVLQGKGAAIPSCFRWLYPSCFRCLYLIPSCFRCLHLIPSCFRCLYLIPQRLRPCFRCLYLIPQHVPRAKSFTYSSVSLFEFFCMISSSFFLSEFFLCHVI